jgi:REP element-mobilizing transposase RayT
MYLNRYCRKLQHKNLVQFYGVCLEPGHISLIIEYIPKAVGLQALLSDNSISLSFATKVISRKNENIFNNKLRNSSLFHGLQTILHYRVSNVIFYI